MAYNLYHLAKYNGIYVFPEYHYSFKQGWYCTIDAWGEFDIMPIYHPVFKTVNNRDFVKAILRYKNNELEK